MPISVPKNLPAISILRKENIYIDTYTSIKNLKKNYLKVLILNLMPKKIETENQFLRLLANSSFPISIQFLKIDNHVSRNTPMIHINKFYQNFKDISKKNFDGLIITGAPLGLINFKNITYWEQIKCILNWTKQHVKSTIFFCWSAQAALNIFYKIPKKIRRKKIFGIFLHKNLKPFSRLLRGFDDIFSVPHSRYSDFSSETLQKYTDLQILSISEEIGPYIFSTKNKKLIFITGHPEYEITTLLHEYKRDLLSGLKPNIPCNYFINNNPKLLPLMNWKSHGNLLFLNWIHYFVS